MKLSKFVQRLYHLASQCEEADADPEILIKDANGDCYEWAGSRHGSAARCMIAR